MARPLVDMVQPQSVRSLEVVRFIWPIGQVGEFVIRCAQRVDQIVYPPAMTAPSKPVPQKDDRLAAALRENLRRRKAQARAKQHGAKPEIQPDKSPRK
jgi:hypothetical protein